MSQFNQYLAPKKRYTLSIKNLKTWVSDYCPCRHCKSSLSLDINNTQELVSLEHKFNTLETKMLQSISLLF